MLRSAAFVRRQANIACGLLKSSRSDRIVPPSVFRRVLSEKVIMAATHGLSALAEFYS
jgi:hypothetical protein